MFTEKQAKQIVLGRFNDQRGTEHEMAVERIYLSERSDHWIVYVNTRLWVEFRVAGSLLVGVPGYLVSCETGEVDTMTDRGPEVFLQDKYDEQTDGGKSPVLVCGYDVTDKQAIIHLHQVFNCSIMAARSLARERRHWFAGRRRFLYQAQKLFESRDVQTTIELFDFAAGTGSATELDESTRLPSINSLPVIDSELHCWQNLEELIAGSLLG